MLSLLNIFESKCTNAGKIRKTENMKFYKKINKNSKIEKFVEKSEIWPKIGNQKFYWKSEIWPRVKYFTENPKFDPKSEIWPKILKLTQNLKFIENLKFDPNKDIWPQNYPNSDIRRKPSSYLGFNSCSQNI